MQATFLHFKMASIKKKTKTNKQKKNKKKRDFHHSGTLKKDEG